MGLHAQRPTAKHTMTDDDDNEDVYDKIML